MKRLALNRSNPASRLVEIQSAAARRQVGALPQLVEAEVNEIAVELGTSINTINDTLVTIDERLNNLENPPP